jgi:N-acetylneuraminate synthase/N,N'-diacetyllegionaminate synthase
MSALLPQFVLGGRIVSMAASYCFVIAEAGVNHNGDPELAEQLITAAAAAGADAVKFQTFCADRLATASAPKADYQMDSARDSVSQRQMLRQLELPEASYPRLQKACERHGLLFLSSPFDEESADFLAGLGVEAFKVPSGELTNLPFLAHLARKGKPLIVSTGMADLGEIEAAVRVIEAEGSPDFALLHCTSEYPCPAEDVNLRAMATLSKAFQRPVGFSDHTEGIAIALAAAALGACMVEKHFTLDRHLPGPDHAASLEPDELRALVSGIRKVNAAMGCGRKRPHGGEAATARVVRKSIVARTDIAAGAIVRSEMVALRRPGTGLPVSELPRVIGRRARAPIAADSLIAWSMFE